MNADPIFAPPAQTGRAVYRLLATLSAVSFFGAGVVATLAVFQAVGR